MLAIKQRATRALAGAAAVAAFGATSAGATTPGTPGVPQASTPIYAENFQNTSTPTWLRLNTYVTDTPGTGSIDLLPPKPAGLTYAADPAWLTGCNGIVLNYSSTSASRPSECVGGSGGGPGNPWDRVRQLAHALGQVATANGSIIPPETNYAVTAYTENTPGANLVEFQTSTNIPLAATSTRFLTFSVDSAARSCGVSGPMLQFSLVNGAAAPVNVGGTINPCVPGTPTWTVPPVGGLTTTETITAGRFSTSASYAYTGTSFGVLVRNANGSGNGNDAAFDNVGVFDATPQLDKSFAPSTIQSGQTSVLTLTITNTSERASKIGFAFTDTLPVGVTVAATPGVINTCGGTVTAVAGAGTVSLGGATPTLAVGSAACVVSVNVTASAVGTYTNNASNITSATGLNLPGASTLTVRPLLRLQKALPSGRVVATDQFTLNMTGMASVTTTGTGSTATGLLTHTGVTTGTTYTLSEAAAATTNLAAYATTYACTNALAGGQTPSGTGSSFAVTPAAGDDLTCTLSNLVAAADLQVAKTISPTGAVRTGAVLTYTLTVDNAGPAAANNAVLRDTPAAGLDCTVPSATASCTASGGASCSGATVPVAALTSTGGVVIPVFPSGGRVVVTMACTVTASGTP